MTNLQDELVILYSSQLILFPSMQWLPRNRSMTTRKLQFDPHPFLSSYLYNQSRFFKSFTHRQIRATSHPRDRISPSRTLHTDQACLVLCTNHHRWSFAAAARCFVHKIGRFESVELFHKGIHRVLVKIRKIDDLDFESLQSFQMPKQFRS